MRLSGFKTFLVHDGYRTFVFLKLYTDDGLTGVGEGSTEWNELAVEAAIRQMCGRLRGADPFQTEALWEQLYRDSYWRNDLIINSAISAIDQACWDLKGKRLGVPVHALLGGSRRERLRAYANAWYWGCTTPDDFARAAKQVVAVQLDACIPNFLIQEYFVTQASWIDEVVTGAPRAVRGEIAVPDRPGLGVELDEAAALAHPFKEAWGGHTLFSSGWQAGLRGGPKGAGA